MKIFNRKVDDISTPEEETQMAIETTIDELAISFEEWCDNKGYHLEKIHPICHDNNYVKSDWTLDGLMEMLKREGYLIETVHIFSADGKIRIMGEKYETNEEYNQRIERLRCQYNSELKNAKLMFRKIL